MQYRYTKTHLALLAACFFATATTFAADVDPTAKESLSPEGSRPNVLVILADDLGFSDLGCYGGDVATPNLDALAAGGLRFTQFYNSSRCCPTRASLLTGKYPHEVGLVRNGASLAQDVPTLAEIFGDNGYHTAMAGKWHLTYAAALAGADADSPEHLAVLNNQTEVELFGEKATYPASRGFHQHYGVVWGIVNYFHPFALVENFKPIYDLPKDYYLTDALNSRSAQMIREFANDKQPFFLYLAHTAPHWPLHARAEDRAKYSGMFDEGWEAMRKRRFDKQVALGLFDPKAYPLPEIDLGSRPRWDSLTDDEKTRDIAKMETHAAMIDRMDQGLGDVIAALKETNQFENTIIFFMSDNGASPEEPGRAGYDRPSETPDGREIRYTGDFPAEEMGQDDTWTGIGPAIANACNTPFRFWKKESWHGGNCTPAIVHWPAGLKTKPGSITNAVTHVFDLLPTFLEATGVNYPEAFNAKLTTPPRGISLMPLLCGGDHVTSRQLFFEHEGGAAMRDSDWKIVRSKPNQAWALFDLATDHTETTDIASNHPERVQTMNDAWIDWWNDVTGENLEKANTPIDPAPAVPSPEIVNRSIEITAIVRGKSLKGVALAQGGRVNGYSLHFIDGKPTFDVRIDGVLKRIQSEDAVTGKIELAARFDDKVMSLSVNGKQVAQGESPGLIPNQPLDGLSLGEDDRTPVGDYASPNPFSGKVLAHSIKTGEFQRVAEEPNLARIMTRWGKQVTPENAWREYPRPMMQRNQWENLNGVWKYAITRKEASQPSEADWTGEIVVPFAVESRLSGVGAKFTPEDALWYRRAFIASVNPSKRTLLNFEAVDYESTVFVNGKQVGTHVGGNLPFTFDISDVLKDGENDLVVRVTDATDTAFQLHGKQRLQPKGIWYTPVSGIWQTVWIEQVPRTYIESIKTTTQIDGHLTFEIKLGGDVPPETGADHISVVAKSYMNGLEMAGSVGTTSNMIIPDPQLWSPDSPTLYDLVVTLKDGRNREVDRVTSYFGIREVGRERDEKGDWRLTLNGQPIFHWGTLDQGWWPDGLLTPPSDEALLFDVQFLKDAGFNTIRKHIKVEPRRFYYHCDRLGMMVWQDQVSSMADNPKWTRLQLNPEQKVWPEAAHAQFMSELKQMMDGLHSHPSIVQWVPFNEAWGQHQTVEVGKWMSEYDKTRLVNIASGGNFEPAGDIVDNHNYPDPSFPFDPERFRDYVLIVGEFGGHGWPVEGHLWDAGKRNWGYGGLPESSDEWLQRYKTSIEKLVELKSQGIAAAIYTQTTDVEGEINGLMTYDREVQKLAPSTLKEISAPLKATVDEK